MTSGKKMPGWTLYQPDSGSEGGDFAAKLSTDATVLYHSQSATYEVYYSAGTEFGDEIDLAAIGFTSTGYVNGDDIDDIDTKPTVAGNCEQRCWHLRAHSLGGCG